MLLHYNTAVLPVMRPTIDQPVSAAYWDKAASLRGVRDKAALCTALLRCTSDGFIAVRC